MISNRFLCAGFKSTSETKFDAAIGGTCHPYFVPVFLAHDSSLLGQTFYHDFAHRLKTVHDICSMSVYAFIYINIFTYVYIYIYTYTPDKNHFVTPNASILFFTQQNHSIHLMIPIFFAW